MYHSPNDIGQMARSSPPPYSPVGKEARVAQSDSATTNESSKTLQTSTSALAISKPCITSNKSFVSAHSSASTTQNADTPSQMPLLIKTKSIVLNSGFDYQPALFHLGIPPDAWKQLSDEIVRTVKRNFGQRTIAIGTGTLMECTCIALGTGVLTGRAIARRQIVDNVRKSMMKKGGLSSVLERWNTTVFAPKGLFVRLDMPEDFKAGYEMTEESFKKRSFNSKIPWNDERKERRRFGIVISRLGDANSMNSPDAAEILDAELEAQGVSGLPSREQRIELGAPVPSRDIAGKSYTEWPVVSNKAVNTEKHKGKIDGSVAESNTALTDSKVAELGAPVPSKEIAGKSYTELPGVSNETRNTESQKGKVGGSVAKSKSFFMDSGIAELDSTPVVSSPPISPSITKNVLNSPNGGESSQGSDTLESTRSHGTTETSVGSPVSPEVQNGTAKSSGTSLKRYLSQGAPVSFLS